ncbi:branched-chain amino acid ABC transporter permease [Pseudooceanicola sp. C21-150M6]|uniref:branched-chain amino acid ABC transporter permease n=1 Tax=Pseudooceanicola sp. C21-150M6 TaxID=3434355 RepID=UPI003D7F80DE
MTDIPSTAEATDRAPVAHRLKLYFRQPPLRRAEWPFLSGVLLLAAGLAVIPGLASDYWLSTARDALIMAIFALAIDLIWGKAGILTLGPTVFFGLGAYGMAIMTVMHGASPFVGMAMGMAAAAALAAVVGGLLIYAGVRLHNFAIATMALLLIVAQLATAWSGLTGGDVGILGVPPLVPALWDVTLSYYVHLALMLMVMLGLWLLTRGGYGRLLSGIFMNETRARNFGYATDFHLTVVFTAGGALAGFAGALFAAASGVIAPDIFSPLMSTMAIIWVAVGGRGTLLGPVIGAIGLNLAQNELSSISVSLWPLILGVIFLAMVLFMPGGLQSLVRKVPT